MNRVALTLLALSSLLSGCIGSCPDEETELLVSGTYSAEVSNMGDGQQDALDAVGDVVAVVDRTAGTMSLTFETPDGQVREVVYDLSEVRVEYL